jgi:hypothetical protein
VLTILKGKKKDDEQVVREEESQCVAQGAICDLARHEQNAESQEVIIDKQSNINSSCEQVKTAEISPCCHQRLHIALGKTRAAGAAQADSHGATAR